MFHELRAMTSGALNDDVVATQHVAIDARLLQCLACRPDVIRLQQIIVLELRRLQRCRVRLERLVLRVESIRRTALVENKHDKLLSGVHFAACKTYVYFLKLRVKL